MVFPPAPARTTAPGRPKDLEKGAAILDAAKRLFTAQGFDGTSMDQIAAEAGVSKLTVYSHFGDKESLFAAAAKAYCEQRLPSTLFEAHPEVPLRERLMQIARAFFAMVSAPEAVAGHRILCTPQMADSPIPRMFWEAGPMRIQQAFAGLLRARVATGELAIDDVDRAASQFFTLLKGEPHAQLVFGCGCGSVGDVQSHLDASVDLFVRAYRVPQ
jgi:TetR/AcrR family transcriptional repressor of mexJK operon